MTDIFVWYTCDLKRREDVRGKLQCGLLCGDASLLNFPISTVGPENLAGLEVRLLHIFAYSLCAIREHQER